MTYWTRASGLLRQMPMSQLLSRELFEKAQVRLKSSTTESNKTTGWEDDERAFYNVFYCGDCKRKMCTRRYRGNVHYFCNAAWYRDERKCSHKSISEEKLQKIVRSELTRQFQLSGLRKKGYVCYKQCGISFQNQ